MFQKTFLKLWLSTCHHAQTKQPVECNLNFCWLLTSFNLNFDNFSKQCSCCWHVKVLIFSQSCKHWLIGMMQSWFDAPKVCTLWTDTNSRLDKSFVQSLFWFDQTPDFCDCLCSNKAGVLEPNFVAAPSQTGCVVVVEVGMAIPSLLSSVESLSWRRHCEAIAILGSYSCLEGFCNFASCPQVPQSHATLLRTPFLRIILFMYYCCYR